LRCTPEAWKKLREYLNVQSNDDVLEELDVDLRWLSLPFIGPKQRSAIPLGSEGTDFWGCHIRKAQNDFNTYYEFYDYLIPSVGRDNPTVGNQRRNRAGANRRTRQSAACNRQPARLGPFGPSNPGNPVTFGAVGFQRFPFGNHVQQPNRLRRLEFTFRKGSQHLAGVAVSHGVTP
jgi:hypothetical protein